MSATTSISFTGGVPSDRAGKYRRPGSGRLIAVELRKMVNTRSGFWLPVGVALATLAVAIIASANHGGRGGTLTHVLHAGAVPSAFLLPVMDVLLICGEWSQRTTLTTFTLVPSRWHVIGAKVGASMRKRRPGLSCLSVLVDFLPQSHASFTIPRRTPAGVGSRRRLGADQRELLRS